MNTYPVTVGEVVAESGPAGLVEDGFVSVAEAATFLGLSRATVYELMGSGKLAHAKFGRSRRIPRRALREFAQSCLVG